MVKTTQVGTLHAALGLSLSLMVAGCASQPQAPRVYSQGTRAVVKVPEFYTVRSGDTVSKIAARYGLDYREVAELNGLDDRYLIFVDQQLRLRANPNRRTQTRPVATSMPGLQTRSLPPVAAPPQMVTPAIATAPTAGATRPGSNGTAQTLQWQWPVALPVSEGFDLNKKVRGLRFAGAVGTPVRAAASGEVVYASNGLPEYGNLLLIRHGDGYISAYAHLQQMNVAQGNRVGAGQQIGLLGTSGAALPMLEFQIRKNGKPVDPTLLLPKT